MDDEGKLQAAPRARIGDLVGVLAAHRVSGWRNTVIGTLLFAAAAPSEGLRMHAAPFWAPMSAGCAGKALLCCILPSLERSDPVEILHSSRPYQPRQSGSGMSFQ